jgi:hypothetical protein
MAGGKQRAEERRFHTNLPCSKTQERKHAVQPRQCVAATKLRGPGIISAARKTGGSARAAVG